MDKKTGLRKPEFFTVHDPENVLCTHFFGFRFLEEILSTLIGKLFIHPIFELNQKTFSGKLFFFEIRLFGTKGVLMMRG